MIVEEKRLCIVTVKGTKTANKQFWEQLESFYDVDVYYPKGSDYIRESVKYLYENGYERRIK